VIEPTTARAGLVAGTVDVIDLHGLLPSDCLVPTPARGIRHPAVGR
jgi:hypothetical protein